MRSIHESNVTSDSARRQPPVAPEAPGGGIGTLAGGGFVALAPDGPATLLVPTESVLLLAVDLPLATRAKRLEALPFAIEDRIAEPIESVHLALGAEIGEKRYLVGVVRHDRMAAWIDAAEAAGMGRAAMVPDALALPVPPPGCWSVDLDGSRAVVRASDGTGFACAAAMLPAAWESAGRPPAIAWGAPLPPEMRAETERGDAAPLAERLAAPALDLRQGVYARRRGSSGGVWRRLGWIAVLGATAHGLIAAADTLMLRAIAERRADETRELVALAAPGIALGDDMIATVTNLLPPPGSGAPQTFLPLMSRVSGALAPLAGSLSTRAIAFDANTLTLDLAAAEPGLAARIGAALRAAQVQATVAESPDGTIRVTAAAA